MQTAMQKIKVSLYEDNNNLRDSLSKLIGAFPEFTLTGAYPNAIDILKNVAADAPDVVLMDIDMPGMSGIDAVALVKHHFPEVKVIMQTVFDDNDKIFRSVCAGAVGYILKKKSPSEILEAIREGYKGGAPITPSVALKIISMFKQHVVPVQNSEFDLSARETEILTHLTKGQSYKMIAESCAISIDTVRFHIKKIYEKLHVHSMTEAVAKALKEKLV
jgi:DNA-binding NarL/FixJ family response regulator